FGVRGCTAEQQRRRDERALLAVRACKLQRVAIAGEQLGFPLELGDTAEHLASLAERSERTHADLLETRIADDDFRETRLDRLRRCFGVRCRHYRLADRRALRSG